MVIGLIGAGNMGSALARGLGEPLLVVDAEPGRAQALAGELGGEALDSAAELGERAEIVVLAHKPAQLDEVAGQLGARSRAVASVLGGTPVAALERAYPERPVYRFMPNLAVEARRGVVCYAPGSRAGEGPERELLALMGRAGTVVELDEPLIEPATALMGCAPAFFALVIEALVDAGVRHGLPSERAGLMASQTMAGTASLLTDGGLDPGELRRRVTSPGGSTARGLAELERGGVRAAFAEAVTAVVEGGR
ncbi:MAG: Pyrroline-5-carboxylate reductase [uncultured Solirubrobacterales bacterium]|uniref:Pyrroline-5-carboxylate reductase n=1 Tax=uncultured Solirubrobacterales bacterium TaxID=768556 RepID=A0A6J4RPV7_9ACTN|nr:MAG: Pyrroline-5-carboxylate reductase [uncultured Solirubrobacterales bacterium]